MRRVEIILSFIAIIAIAMAAYNVPGGVMLTAITFFIYSAIYFFGGIFVLNGIPLRFITKKESYIGISSLRMTGSALLGIVYSISLIAILFTILHWPGAEIMMVISGVLLIAATIICFIKLLNDKQVFYKNCLIRNAFYLLFIIFLYLYNYMSLENSTIIS